MLILFYGSKRSYILFYSAFRSSLQRNKWPQPRCTSRGPIDMSYRRVYTHCAVIGAIPVTDVL